MNMIICGEECRHQKDGYCMLDNLTQTRSRRRTAVILRSAEVKIPRFKPLGSFL